MAALDDRYDVYDECQRLGLDYNRLDHQGIARQSLQKRYFSRDTTPAPPMPPVQQAEWLKLFKRRYGDKP